MSVIHAAEVEWFEAADNYVKVHSRERTGYLRESMNALEERVNPDQFVRISRSAMVNLRFIRELRLRTNGDYDVVLSDGKVLSLSRTYRKTLFQRLG